MFIIFICKFEIIYVDSLIYSFLLSSPVTAGPSSSPFNLVLSRDYAGPYNEEMTRQFKKLFVDLENSETINTDARRVTPCNTPPLWSFTDGCNLWGLNISRCLYVNNCPTDQNQWRYMRSIFEVFPPINDNFLNKSLKFTVHFILCYFF